MLAFFIGQAPIWGDAPTGERGVAHPAPHFDESEHSNFRLWTFTPSKPDAPTILCHVSDFETIGEGLKGIYRWVAVEHCAQIEARGFESPAFLRMGRQLWKNRTPCGDILKVR